MTIAHFIFQKKGGVGKSLIASMWFQYLAESGHEVFGIDTDPSNHTFSGFKELCITELNILDQDEDIDSIRFDSLVENIFSLKKEDHLVIDSGSSCFVTLIAYLKQNNAFEAILAGGHRIYIHVPVTGGPDMVHTSACLDELVDSFPEIPFVVWKNQYNGELISKDGNEVKKFEDFKVFKKHVDSFVAVVEIPQKKKETFGKDIMELLASKQTFKTAINSANPDMTPLPLMARQRLKTFWTEASQAMSVALEAVNSGGRPND